MEKVADDMGSGKLSKATMNMISDYGIMRDQVRNARRKLQE